MVYRNELSPFVFRLSEQIGLRWYGVAYVFGFFLAYMALRRAIAGPGLPGVTRENLDRLVAHVIGGVVLGGRLGYVVQNLPTLSKDWLFPVKLWEGGMTFFGGLLGVVASVLLFCRGKWASFWSIADALVLPASLALGFGRLANFANAELWGKPTHSNWGVIYPRVDTLPRHPSELYEAASHFLLAIALCVLVPKFRLGSRMATATFLIGYGFLRFLTDFYREEPALIGVLNSGQLASLGVMLIGCLVAVLGSHGSPRTMRERSQSS